MTTAITVTDHRFPGPHGEVEVRSYEPRDGRDGGASAATAATDVGFVWVHGGAFFAGDLDMPEADWVSRSLAERGITVVSVTYQLAPRPEWLPAEGGPATVGGDAHFPVASEEVAAALEWARTVFDSRSTIRWSLGGASAGANLAAGAAMRLLRSPGDLPITSVLVYPVLHSELPPADERLSAALDATTGPFPFTRELAAAINLNYVGDPRLLADPSAFPGGHDLDGFPPTLIITSEVDLLRPSGEQFAAELLANGVEVHAVREWGTAHGHLNEPENPKASVSVDRIARWLLASRVDDAAPARSAQ